MDMVRICLIDCSLIPIDLEHIHSLIDHPYFILGVGFYATISNCLLGIAILCMGRCPSIEMKINELISSRYRCETFDEIESTIKRTKTKSQTTFTEKTHIQIL